MEDVRLECFSFSSVARVDFMLTAPCSDLVEKASAAAALRFRILFAVYRRFVMQNSMK